MNILLWILQAALAWLCIAGGAYHLFNIEELQQRVASMRALPRGLWKSLGAFACLAGLCLIVPGLTPFAALGVGAESILISALYLYYGDHFPLMYSAAMALLAALIFYGRFELRPFFV